MPEPQLQYVQRRLEQGNLVLTVTESRLDSENLAHMLHVELLAAADTGEPANVVLNLEGVHKIHTMALQSLLDLRRRLADSAGQIVLCGLSPIVAEVLRITGLIDTSGQTSDALFATEPDVASAIARLNSTKSATEPTGHAP